MKNNNVSIHGFSADNEGNPEESIRPNFIALPECHIFPIQDSFPSDLDLWDEDPELQCVLYCKCLDDTMLAGP